MSGSCLPGGCWPIGEVAPLGHVVALSEVDGTAAGRPECHGSLPARRLAAEQAAEQIFQKARLRFGLHELRLRPMRPGTALQVGDLALEGGVADAKLATAFAPGGGAMTIVAADLLFELGELSRTAGDGPVERCAGPEAARSGLGDRAEPDQWQGEREAGQTERGRPSWRA